MIDHAPLFERLFDFLPIEGDYEIEAEGELPSYLRGSYYLNGPCRFQNGDVRYRHWLDGDGMVSALHFDGSQKVRFVNRFVRGKKWCDEEAAGKALYRAFGTCFAGDQLKRGIGLESPMNVSAYWWNGKLLAFGEQGLPWELDPQTLESRGEYTFGGRFNAISPMSAHAHIDPESGELFNFGVSFSARQPSLTVYRIAAEGEILYRRRVPLEWPASVHDFMLGKNHLLFYVSPHILEVDKLIAGECSLMDALGWQPRRGSRILVLERATGELVATFEIEGRYCLHLINSFEQAGQLVLDVVELERPVYDQYQIVPDLFPDAPLGGPRRYRLDLAAKTFEAEARIAYDAAPDFPAIDPRRLQKEYDDLWLLGMSNAEKPGRKFFDQIVHLSWSHPGTPDLWQAPEKHYLGGEPIFLGDPRSDHDGCVICQIFDAENRSSAFLIFDAAHLAQGPIARLRLKSPIPACFHASFHPAS